MAAPAFSLLLAPARVAGRVVRSVLARHRAMGALGQLDDRLLHDIGLTRHDLWCVRAEPLFRDPTVALAARADAARAEARGVARERLALAELRRLWAAERRAA